jgi:hypothetical protein
MAECGCGSVIAHRLRALFCSTQVNLTMPCYGMDRPSNAELQKSWLRRRRRLRLGR